MAGDNPANNTWGPIAMQNVPTGQYTVYAGIVYKDACNNTKTFITPTAVVNVQ
jgi:hypothetical protein